MDIITPLSYYRASMFSSSYMAKKLDRVKVSWSSPPLVLVEETMLYSEESEWGTAEFIMFTLELACNPRLTITPKNLPLLSSLGYRFGTMSQRVRCPVTLRVMSQETEASFFLSVLLSHKVAFCLRGCYFRVPKRYALLILYEQQHSRHNS